MENWLEQNENCYVQSSIDGKKYVVEVYNERFEEGIVEIMIPIISVNKED